jgi:hypothetical protein
MEGGIAPGKTWQGDREPAQVQPRNQLLETRVVIGLDQISSAGLGKISVERRNG